VRDGGRPPAAGLQEQVANHRKRRGSKAWVVSDTEKASERRQVGDRKANISKLPFKCESESNRDPTRDRPQHLDTTNEILFRVGSRSASIGTPTSDVLADDLSDLLLFWPGSRFGADSHALVEADIGRYKRVIGDALRSRTKGRQTTEVAIAVASLNRMLEIGRPEYVRLT